MNNPFLSQSLTGVSDWLSYIDTLHSQTIDLGLERVREVAQRASVIKPAPITILIGGTNGKGTCSQFLESVFIRKGLRVGVYNSPHIVSYTETVRINANPVDESLHLQAFEFIEQCRSDTSLSPFEFCTLQALRVIQAHDVDIALIEVGMGGAGDATNIVDADYSVITTIAIDHQAWLGNDRHAIGAEKAGIARYERPLIIGDFSPPQTALSVAKNHGAKLVCANTDFSFQQYATYWRWQGKKQTFDTLVNPNIPIQNVSSALALLEQMNIKCEQAELNQTLETLVVPGRFEKVSAEPDVFLDVAHNPEAAAYLTQRLASLRDTSHIIGIAGILADKDIPSVLSPLLSVLDELICVGLPETPRGAPASQISAIARALITEHNSETVLHSDESTVADGLTTFYTDHFQSHLKTRHNDVKSPLLIVFGSFFTVAASYSFFENHQL